MAVLALISGEKADASIRRSRVAAARDESRAAGSQAE